MSSPALVDPKRSLWVSAHAGAGKTRVLIDRVARLLVAGTKPEQILCLTFTKAAAAEMAARLSASLGTLALADEATLRRKLAALHVEDPSDTLLAETRTLFARALETPGGLKIQTIHAFCERLLGRFPIEAGIAPGFEVLDDRTAAELLDIAQGEILREAGDPEARTALVTLAQLGDGASLRGMVVALLAARRDLSAQGAPVAIEACAARVPAALGLAESETPDAVTEEFLAGVPREAMRRAADLLAASSVRDRERGNALAKMAAEISATALDAYIRVFAKEDGGPKRDVCTQAVRSAHPDIEAALRAEQVRVGAYIERHRLASTAERARAALTIGTRIIARYETLKQRRAALDYDDLIARTVGLFARSAAAWVLYKLDSGIDHILVDEAQDTNPLQWQVITALADEFFAGASARQGPRSVFAVGDEKQSIYRFQGADPAIFATMEARYDEKLRGIGAELHTPVLHLTRRSTKPVLDLVDAVFADPVLASGLSSRAAPLRHALARNGQAGVVELWPTEKPADGPEPKPWNVPLDFVSPESPRARLARRIADLIRSWLDTKEVLPSQERPIRPGDVMILVRRRDVFVDEVIRVLKKRGIPVAGTDRLKLTAHIAVMDLVALARFVLLPEDDLALATVLKSPFFGLTDGDLFRLAHGRDGSLWKAVSEDADARCRARLSALIALAARETPFGFFTQVLGPLGGRAQLVGRLGADAEDPIDELLRTAYEFERRHPPVLQGFVSWLKAGETDVKRDMDQDRDEVRVMTVHGAKGLESNIVILPDTCAMPHTQKRPCFLTVNGLPIWSQRTSEEPAPVAAARREALAAAGAEHLRLLYVALTRARDRLYVCGHETGRGRDPASWHALVEAAMKRIGTPQPLPSGETAWRLETPQERAPDTREAPARIEGRGGAPPAWMRMPARPEPPSRRTVSPTSLGEEGAPDPPVLSPRRAGAAGKLRFERGRLIHRLLQMLPMLDAAAREAAARRFLALPRHGLGADAQDEIAASVLRVLATPEFAPLFAEGSRAEVPVVGEVALRGRSVPVFGIIDRLAVTPAGIWIIDYKTNRPPPSRLEDVPSAYVSQMAAYGALLAQVYEGRPLRAALLWTESLTLMALPQARLTAALDNARVPLP